MRMALPLRQLTWLTCPLFVGPGCMGFFVSVDWRKDDRHGPEEEAIGAGPVFPDTVSGKRDRLRSSYCRMMDSTRSASRTSKTTDVGAPGCD